MNLDLLNKVALVTGYVTLALLLVALILGLAVLVAVLWEKHARRILKWVWWLFPSNQRKTLHEIRAVNAHLNQPVHAQRILSSWWINLYPVFKEHCTEIAEKEEGWMLKFYDHPKSRAARADNA